MLVNVNYSDYMESSLNLLKKTLNDHNIKYVINKKTITSSIDIVIVLGGDKGVMNYFHRIINSNIPVLGINDSEINGFLSQIDLKEFPLYVDKLKQHDYKIEEIPRINIKIDGKLVIPILNDLSIFPSKSAVLMEHTLKINNEEVWHDSSDGIIISTPIGSSAYSMSAGGPIIFHESPVFGIISVNSINITRRPLIVSNSSSIIIDDISSRLYCEVILDGLYRLRVNKTIECTKFSPTAKIIRIKENSTTIDIMKKKVHLAKDLLNMPPSLKLLLKTLEYEGAMTNKELILKTLLPSRTVRLALQQLLSKGYIKRKISLRDSRQRIYEIS